MIDSVFAMASHKGYAKLVQASLQTCLDKGPGTRNLACSNTGDAGKIPLASTHCQLRMTTVTVLISGLLVGTVVVGDLCDDDWRHTVTFVEAALKSDWIGIRRNRKVLGDFIPKLHAVRWWMRSQVGGVQREKRGV